VVVVVAAAVGAAAVGVADARMLRRRGLGGPQLQAPAGALCPGCLIRCRAGISLTRRRPGLPADLSGACAQCETS
jgi:hypothetical protein